MRPAIVVASIALGAALGATCVERTDRSDATHEVPPVQVAPPQPAPAPKPSPTQPKPKQPPTPPPVAPPHGERPTVFVTGSDDGYLDACGCDGGLLGGLPRRHTLLKQIGGAGEQGLLLSNGRLVAGTSPLDGMKFEALLLAMVTMGYDGIALSERELALGRERLVELSAFLGAECPLLATNLRDDGAPKLPVRRSVEHELAKSKVLVLAAIAKSREELFRAADPKVVLLDPVHELQAEIDRRPDADHVVVLAQASIAEASALAEALPRVELVVVQGSGDDEDPKTKPIHAGSAAIVTTGRKGRFVVSWRFGEGETAGEFRREPVEEDTLEKSPDVEDVILRTYRERLKDDSPRPIEQFLEQRPTASGASYAGAAEGSCASCHPKAWATWAASRHAQAWQALVDQDLPPTPEDTRGKAVNAIWDPDCVKCHVTGFGEKSGWAGVEKELARANEGAPLVNVTCEACHGPAGDHAERAQNGDSKYPSGHAPKMPLEGRVLSIEETDRAEAFCMRCHDHDNSPNFLLGPTGGYWIGVKLGKQVGSVAHGKE